MITTRAGLAVKRAFGTAMLIATCFMAGCISSSEPLLERTDGALLNLVPAGYYSYCETGANCELPDFLLVVPDRRTGDIVVLNPDDSVQLLRLRQLQDGQLLFEQRSYGKPGSSSRLQTQSFFGTIRTSPNSPGRLEVSRADCDPKSMRIRAWYVSKGWAEPTGLWCKFDRLDMQTLSELLNISGTEREPRYLVRLSDEVGRRSFEQQRSALRK